MVHAMTLSCAFIFPFYGNNYRIIGTRHVKFYTDIDQNVSINSVWLSSFICTITKKETVQNFEVKADKFDVVGICN